MRRILSLLSISCMLLVVAPAYGQKQDKDQSYRHFLAAKELEARGSYEAAAREYLEAYEFYQSPEFFYNAGRAYELHGSLAKAIEHYQKYIAAAPHGRAADRARAAIARLKPGPGEAPPEPTPEGAHGTRQESSAEEVEQLARRLEEEAPPETADTGKSEQPATTPESTSRPGDVPPPRSHATPDDTIDLAAIRRARTERGRTVRLSGLLAGGAGLASLSLGIYFGVEAHHLAGDIEGVRDQWTTADLSKYSEGKRASTRAIVLTGAGTAALIAGGALYVWGARRMDAEAQAQVSVAPWIAPSSTGFSVAGSF